jgi:hypothetical protein
VRYKALIGRTYYGPARELAMANYGHSGLEARTPAVDWTSCTLHKRHNLAYVVAAAVLVAAPALAGQ